MGHKESTMETMNPLEEKIGYYVGLAMAWAILIVPLYNLPWGFLLRG